MVEWGGGGGCLDSPILHGMRPLGERQMPFPDEWGGGGVMAIHVLYS